MSPFGPQPTCYSQRSKSALRVKADFSGVDIRKSKWVSVWDLHVLTGVSQGLARLSHRVLEFSVEARKPFGRNR